ncbi:hypothetical protein [Halotia branconii]|uniref:Uncharacterized protein n=1 Tax=Halotia branconii CENA392 TaxID=1539056 RepID=A0AAJ6PC81_9CYAN|nr:hypothetical protein [Halotia branconii]WGV28587.1 hypothetical protein QI031_14485 [Halotia branconii CENA392]
MQLIKKSERLLLKKIKLMEEAEEQTLPADTPELLEPIFEKQPELEPESQELKYIPTRDNPEVQSVGNSGWQPSEIWKDIRLDGF